MKNEIPVPLIRVNQWFIVLSVLLAFITGSPLWIVFAWVIVAASVFFGPQAHLIVRLVKPLLRKKLVNATTEDAGLQRFNQTLALIFLTISVAGFYLLNNPLVGYVAAAVLAVVAFIAICGYCLGCTFYYLWNQQKRKWTK